MIPYLKEIDENFKHFLSILLSQVYEFDMITSIQQRETLIWSFNLISLIVSLIKYTLRLVTLNGPAPLLDMISVGFDLNGYKMLNTQQ